MQPKKTNAVRILEAQGVAFELRSYDVDEEDLSAPSVARKVGLPPEQVFKTLCVRGDRNGVCFAVVAADMELDLKALARLSGDRKVEPVALKELEGLTGYIRGGVTAVGARKKYPVYLEASALLHGIMSVSAGVRGTQVLLKPQEYVRCTGATVGEIGRRSQTA